MLEVLTVVGVVGGFLALVAGVLWIIGIATGGPGDGGDDDLGPMDH